MRILMKQLENGRKVVNWTAIGVLALVVHVTMISSIELFWYMLTGGVSPLLGGFALVTSILIVVRIIGESMHSAHQTFPTSSEMS